MKFAILFLSICLIWCLSEVSLVVFRRAGKSSQNRDSGSLLWLNLTIYGSLAFGVGLALHGVGRIDAFRRSVPLIGLYLIVAGLAIRWLSIATLWKYFTVQVAISVDHRLMQSGIYGFVRHPSYLGTMVSILGLGIALSSWITLLVVVVPAAGSFLRRINIEERVLREAFGLEYVTYCERTKRLIPFLY